MAFKIALIVIIMTNLIASSIDGTYVYVKELEEWQEINAVITAYSSVETCLSNDCIMASGRKAYIGAVACPRSVKLSTKVFIDGNLYVCEDRTAQKYNGRYDIFMGYGQEAFEKAINYGKQNKEIRF